MRSRLIFFCYDCFSVAQRYLSSRTITAASRLFYLPMFVGTCFSLLEEWDNPFWIAIVLMFSFQSVSVWLLIYFLVSAFQSFWLFNFVFESLLSDHYTFCLEQTMNPKQCSNSIKLYNWGYLIDLYTR